MAIDVTTKITQLKALLGDQAAQAALNAAEANEQAAKEAGLRSKEVTVKADAEEADEVQPLSLADLLAEIEDGIDAGAIVDDVTEPEAEEQEDTEAKEVDEETALKELEAFVVEVATKVADERFKEHVTKLKELFVPREQEREAQVADLKAKLKEAQDSTAAIQASLDELLGGQPKRYAAKGYRASQDDKTAVSDKASRGTPQPDPMDSFLNDFVLRS